MHCFVLSQSMRAHCGCTPIILFHDWLKCIPGGFWLRVLEIRLPRPPSAVYARTRKEVPSIEVDWPHDLDLTVTFYPLRAMVMTYSHAKVQSQQSVGSEDRVETNGQTDGGDCITSLAIMRSTMIYAIHVYAVGQIAARWYLYTCWSVCFQYFMLMHLTITLGVLVLHAYYMCRPKCRLGRRQTWLWHPDLL